MHTECLLRLLQQPGESRTAEPQQVEISAILLEVLVHVRISKPIISVSTSIPISMSVYIYIISILISTSISTST